MQAGCFKIIVVAILTAALITSVTACSGNGSDFHVPETESYKNSTSIDESQDDSEKETSSEQSAEQSIEQSTDQGGEPQTEEQDPNQSDFGDSGTWTGEMYL